MSLVRTQRCSILILQSLLARGTSTGGCVYGTQRAKWSSPSNSLLTLARHDFPSKLPAQLGLSLLFLFLLQLLCCCGSRLSPGDVILLTYMKLVAIAAPPPSPPPRSCFAASSEFTDVIMGQRLENLKHLPVVKAIADFAMELVNRNETAGDESGFDAMGAIRFNNRVASLLLSESVSCTCLVAEGTGCLMTRPVSIDEYCAMVGNGSLQPAVDDGAKPSDTSEPSPSSFSSIETVSFTELSDVKETLQYREMKCVLHLSHRVRLLILACFLRRRAFLRGYVVDVIGGSAPADSVPPAPPKPAKRRRTDASTASVPSKDEVDKETEGVMASPLYKLRSRRVRKALKPSRLSAVLGGEPSGGGSAPGPLSTADHIDPSIPSFRIAASLADGSPSVTLPISHLTALSRSKRLPVQALFSDDVLLSKQLCHLLPPEFKGSSLKEWKTFCLSTPLTLALTLYRTSGSEVEASIEGMYV